MFEVISLFTSFYLFISPVLEISPCSYFLSLLLSLTHAVTHILSIKRMRNPPLNPKSRLIPKLSTNYTFLILFVSLLSTIVPLSYFQLFPYLVLHIIAS